MGIALDDVGVAYSSLALLQLFPFDRIKIDRCFVHNVGRRPNSAAIFLNALAQLGQQLGMQVTAEGIETHEDLATARASGCSDGQGFLLGPPVAHPDFGEPLTRAGADAEISVLQRPPPELSGYPDIAGVRTCLDHSRRRGGT